MNIDYIAFANTLVNYSARVQKGEQVIIHAYDVVPKEMILAIIEMVREAGGNVADVWWDAQEIEDAIMRQTDRHQLRIFEMGRMVQMCAVDANIILRGFSNPFAQKDVPPGNQKMRGEGVGKQLLDERVNFTRWILTRWPTDTMATMAGMPTQSFADFFFQTVSIDYARMSKAMDPLVALMQKTDKVRIVGPGDTDLTFSIKGIHAEKCDGRRNIPDGEVYTAPVRTSINGVMHYNTPSVTKEGHEFGGVRFVFRAGKIGEATCESGDIERLNRFLDTDEGARYIGEFAIGLNPAISTPMKETLFDEKIHGSIHLTPGQCYDVAPNGNHSAIHWDLVLIQRSEYGGGSIYFDGKLIRKDGLFIPKALKGLNPEALAK